MGVAILRETLPTVHVLLDNTGIHFLCMMSALVLPMATKDGEITDSPCQRLLVPRDRSHELPDSNCERRGGGGTREGYD